MKTICVVTGTRAEYGLLKPVMKEIQSQRGLSLRIAVCGMHWMDTFGRTAEELKTDGFAIDEKRDRIVIEPESTDAEAMGMAVAQGIQGFIRYFTRQPVDVVLVLGDRTEVFAAAIAAMFCRKVVAHIHGGDTGRGGFDESMRHAVTKLAHLHFVATQKSYDRIIRMGEKPERVYLVGAPGLDGITAALLSREELKERLPGLDSPKPPIVVVFHPQSTQPEEAEEQMRSTMESVCAFGHPVVLLGSNNDAGWTGVYDVSLEFEKRGVIREPSLPRQTYLSLLKHAAVLVGNSSSGIIEAASFKLPVVNVGERQLGREHAENVIDVPAQREEIEKAIRTALEDETFRAKLEHLSNPYGDGHAAERIVKVLEELEINHELIQKQFCDGAAEDGT